MKTIKITAVLVALCLAMLSAAACSGDSSSLSSTDAGNNTAAGSVSEEAETNALGEEAVLPEEELNSADMFTDRDKEVGYSEADSTRITLNSSSATVSGSGASASGQAITISEEGTYILTGTLTNGSITVEVDKTEKVQLVLSGASITNSSTAPIYIKQADKVFITLDSATTNTLSVTGEYVAIDENSIDAAIFSKEDLTINGSGTLKITTAAGHGIVSKDDLAITGGTLSITSAKQGLSGKNSVRICDGTFTIVSGADGIHCENSDDASLGFIFISGGKINITAETDAISASNTAQIDGGAFTVKSGGGSANASMTSGGNAAPGWGMWGRQGGAEASSSTEETASAKGIKAGGNITINAGTFTIDSSDDALHSNSSVYINAGTITVLSGDDGIHADTKSVINGGTVAINKSYEGIEGQSIDITGGTITVTANDDALNAAGGNDFSSANGRPGEGSFNTSASSYIKISGGKVTIDATGDGIDSNGSLAISGGTIYVSGPTNSGNGALDYAGEASITGGTLIAAGSAGMAQNLGGTSTQGSILYNFSSSISGGTAVTLKDSSGNTVAEYTPTKQYQSVVISTPKVASGSTYTISAGNESAEIEMTSVTYSNGGSAMGGGLGGRGDKWMGSMNPPDSVPG